MKLSQLLDENPDAKAEHVAALGVARDEGIQSVRAVVDKAVPFIQSEDYPLSIKNLAIDVIKGSTDPVALTSAAAAVDAVKEQGASAGAVGETNVASETAPNGETSSDYDGKIKSMDDINSGIACMKKGA